MDELCSWLLRFLLLLALAGNGSFLAGPLRPRTNQTHGKGAKEDQ